MKFLDCRHMKFRAFALAVVAGATFGAGPALAVDWTGVPSTTITLFYPGQSSWEWLLTDHGGAKRFREGKKCRECHDGEEVDIGAAIVSGEDLEPTPVPGKRGSIPVQVKTAHDSERLYFQLQWSPQELSGVSPMDADYSSKVAVIFDDGSVVEAVRAGCWSACHDDATNMPSHTDGPLEKYLGRSRVKLTRSGGGLNFKSDAELAAMVSGGEYVEYWQARLNPGARADVVSGYILKDRTEHASNQVTANATYANGVWTVEFSRPLQVSGEGYKSFVAGKTYSLGFAIHDAHAANRFHHVSYVRTLALDGGDADLIAVKQ